MGEQHEQAGTSPGPVTPLDRLRAAVAGRVRGARGLRTTHQGTFQDAHPLAAVMAHDVIAVAEAVPQPSQVVQDLLHGARRGHKTEAVHQQVDDLHHLIEAAEAAGVT